MTNQWKNAFLRDLQSKREKYCEILELYRGRLNNGERNPKQFQVNIDLK